MDGSTPGFSVHHQLPELAQIHAHRVSDAIQPSHPLLAPLLLPSIFPSISVFSNESVHHIRWPNYWPLSKFGGGKKKKKRFSCLCIRPPHPRFCEWGLSKGGLEGEDSGLFHQDTAHLSPLGHVLLTAAANSPGQQLDKGMDAKGTHFWKGP